jgi:hypothetical protein
MLTRDVSKRTRSCIGLALVFALAASTATPPQALADKHDCTYDQDNQRRVVRELARRHPGGRVDEEDRRITWALPSGGSIVFLYGGCTHLGSIVTRTEPRSTALPRDRVFAIATDLATRYWNKADADELKAGLAKRAFETEVVDGRTYYQVRREDYSQFSVEYEFRDGTSRVEIAWSRNF